MKTSAILLLAFATLPVTAFADRAMSLKPNSVLCFSYGDWKEVLAASKDGDEDAASRLVESGACRIVSKVTQVIYLDPAAGNIGALIQLPSGKTAYTANAFLK